jgi:hypothetical protein
MMDADSVDVPAPSDVLEAITEPARDVTETVADVATDSIHGLAEAVRLQHDDVRRNTDAIGRIEGNLSDLLNRITGLSEQLTASAVETGEEAVEAVTEVPAEAAETIEAVVESAPEPPKRKKTLLRRNQKRR